MRRAFIIVSILCVVSVCGCASVDDGRGAKTAIVWQLDDLTSVGGHETTALGAPEIIETANGRAVEFDGIRDGLLVDALPLAGAEKFTLEIVFRPDARGLKEQRFLHLQEDGSESRILIETRLTKDNRWYLDTYIHSGKGSHALYEPANMHPAGRWYSAALIYDGRCMRHYVNGTEEMSAPLEFEPLGDGKVSIGVRMNRVYWFKGAIRRIKFTPEVLEPKQLLMP